MVVILESFSRLSPWSYSHACHPGAEGDRVHKSLMDGFCPNPLARSYPCTHGCDIDASRHAKRLSNIHTSMNATFALWHTLGVSIGPKGLQNDRHTKDSGSEAGMTYSNHQTLTTVYILLHTIHLLHIFLCSLFSGRKHLFWTRVFTCSSIYLGWKSFWS